VPSADIPEVRRFERGGAARAFFPAGGDKGCREGEDAQQFLGAAAGGDGGMRELLGSGFA
jgi:hypothetical protein